jgi:ribulose-phosphate 3-epimerase
MIQIFPSLIGGDILALRDQIAVLDPYCAGYHLDLMDGHFVPNITWGPAFINAIAQTTTKRIWVHIMATDPLHWAEHLKLPEQSMVDFHIEVSRNPIDLLQTIKKYGWRAGVAISPYTTLTALTPYLLECADYITVMSVDPGFSGQAFMPASIQRVRELVALRAQKKYQYAIAIDGGINTSNIVEVTDAGVQYIAMASALFAEGDPVKILKKLAQYTAEKDSHQKNT